MSSAPVWVAPAAGLALGIAAAIGNTGPAGSNAFFFFAIANAGSIWLLLAFVMGWLHRDSVRGLLAGLAALLIAVVTYYAMLLVVFEPRTAPSALIRAGAIWFVIALVSGPAGGIAGSLARSGMAQVRILSTGLVTGVIAGEAFWSIAQMWRLSDRLMYGILLVLAVAVAWLVLRRARHVAIACAIGVVTGGVVAWVLPAVLSVGRDLGV